MQHDHTVSTVMTPAFVIRTNLLVTPTHLPITKGYPLMMGNHHKAAPDAFGITNAGVPTNGRQ
jgi:hypothetical protein